MKIADHIQPNRADILTNAIDKITGSRQEQYGDPRASHDLIAALWTNYLSVHPQGPLLPHDVAVMCVLQKVARIALNPTHADNYEDIAGYGGIAGELAPLPAQPDLPMSLVGGTPMPEICRPAKPTDHLYIPLDKAVEASRMAHQLLGATMRDLSLETQLFLRQCVLKPTEMTGADFTRLIELTK